MPEWTCRIPVRRASVPTRLGVSCQDVQPVQTFPQNVKQTQFPRFQLRNEGLPREQGQLAQMCRPGRPPAGTSARVGGDYPKQLAP